MDNGAPLTKPVVPPFDDVLVLGVSTFIADPDRHQIALAPKLTGPPNACEEAADDYLERYTNARVAVNFQPDP